MREGQLTHLYKLLHSHEPCVCRNAEKILGYLNNGVLSRELIPSHINFSQLTTEDYASMYDVIQRVKEDSFDQLGLDACLLEDELNKVSGRTSDSFFSLFVAFQKYGNNSFGNAKMEIMQTILFLCPRPSSLPPPGGSGHWPGLHRLH